MSTVRKILAYFWDMKAKRIEKFEQEARHPYVKKADEVEGKRKRGHPSRKRLAHKFLAENENSMEE